MKLIRYQDSGQKIHFGWVLGDKIGQIVGDIFGEYQRDEATIPLEDVKLLAPVYPSKIIAIGRNYAAHAEELPTTSPLATSNAAICCGHAPRASILLPP